MKLSIFAILIGTAFAAEPYAVDTFTGRPRVIVLSDIGNEPDDQMSLVRFLLYGNEFEVEALVATTSTWQRKAVRPDIMHSVIEAYGRIRDNLLKHGSGWLTAEELDSKVCSGQPGYGLASTGPDQMSEGARAIIRAADREDARPIWIAVWGGANTLAQALLHVRNTRPKDIDRIVEKLRVYSISDQDDAGPWIRREFPGLFYIVHPSGPNSGEYLLRHVDRHQRRCLLSQWRWREHLHGHQRMARREHPQQRSAGQGVSEIHVHHGRRHAVISWLD